jgi:hypothetical protein
MITLLQARDYLKSHPQYDKKHKPYFCALTVYDNLGKAIYSEGISHVLYRRYCQKVIPSRLLDISNIILPKDLDEPILLVDKNKNIIASTIRSGTKNIKLLSKILQKFVKYLSVSISNFIRFLLSSIILPHLKLNIPAKSTHKTISTTAENATIIRIIQFLKRYVLVRRNKKTSYVEEK